MMRDIVGEDSDSVGYGLMYGLHAARRYVKGETITVYVGEKLGAEGTVEADAEYERRRRAGGGKHVMRLWVGRMLVDGQHGYTGAQYINAAYHAPAGWVNNAEMVSSGTIKATRNIEAGHEILMAYGDAYWRAWGEAKPKGRPAKRAKCGDVTGGVAEWDDGGAATMTPSQPQLLHARHRRGQGRRGEEAMATEGTAQNDEEHTAGAGWWDDEGGRRVAAVVARGRGRRGRAGSGRGGRRGERGGARGSSREGVGVPIAADGAGQGGGGSRERKDPRRVRWTAGASDEFNRRVRARHERGEGGGVT